MPFTADQAARLTGRARQRRADGSRELRARLAWRRLVRACGRGDPAVQDAVRDTAHDLPDADVLDLLAAAPEEPADHAAYLTLIGQDAQRQALDPDGSLLSVAYWAAHPALRERLRTAMAAAGDSDAVRVVAAADQRDRIAALSGEDLDYLGRHLAEHRRWDDLRRLARDLPLDKAAAAARLLPEQERTTPSGPSPEEIRATVDRLPRHRLIIHKADFGDPPHACFSPDSSELALIYENPRIIRERPLQVDVLHIGTGQAVSLGDGVRELRFGRSVLHLGGEILITRRPAAVLDVIHRVAPDIAPLCPPDRYSVLRRSSGGGLAVGRAGLTFIGLGAGGLRHRPIPRLAKLNNKKGFVGPYLEASAAAVATLPEARLVALFTKGAIFVVDEDGNVRHEAMQPEADPEFWHNPALTFLSPNSLALNELARLGTGQYTEIWQLPPHGPPRRTVRHVGAIRDLRPLEQWRGLPLDEAFAARVGASDGTNLDSDLLGTQDPSDPAGGSPPRRVVLASPGCDIVLTTVGRGVCEVHSPHLPAVRDLLERPLLRSGPNDLQQARSLREKIGDPAVREALDLLAAHLADRFGGDIALGAGPAAATPGTTDIALNADRQG
ncbi:hypothetical protein [Actinomadura sp. 9N215]|uniref:hypothetical protein n=1 Tax=Actinomadura sp. 9N215 TaxID=3375150 RepID=UPI00379AB2D0